MTNFHPTWSFRSTIMDDIRKTMKLLLRQLRLKALVSFCAHTLVDTMSRITPDDPVTFRFDDFFNLVADLTIRHTGFTYGDSFLD